MSTLYVGCVSAKSNAKRSGDEDQNVYEVTKIPLLDMKGSVEVIDYVGYLLPAVLKLAMLKVLNATENDVPVAAETKKENGKEAKKKPPVEKELSYAELSHLIIVADPIFDTDLLLGAFRQLFPKVQSFSVDFS